jgi:alpha-D-ribose 1-methylphosphonate 5-triphosphate synthase subunit PhnL
VDLILQARARGAALVGIFHDAEVRQAVSTRNFELGVAPSPTFRSPAHV